MSLWAYHIILYLRDVRFIPNAAAVFDWLMKYIPGALAHILVSAVILMVGI